MHAGIYYDTIGADISYSFTLIVENQRGSAGCLEPYGLMQRAGKKSNCSDSYTVYLVTMVNSMHIACHYLQVPFFRLPRGRGIPEIINHRHHRSTRRHRFG